VELKHPLLFYVPGVRAEQLGGLGAARFETVAAAVEALMEGLPVEARVAVIPEGPYAFARVAQREMVGA
jgi:hypothetical protein